MKVTGRSLHPMIGLAIRDHRVLMPSFPDAPLDLAEKIEAALPTQCGRPYRSCLPSAPRVPKAGCAASRSGDIDLK